MTERLEMTTIGVAAPNPLRGVRPGGAIALAFLLLAVAVLALPGRAEAYLYWANYNLSAGTSIGRALLDGSSSNPSFITPTPDPGAVAVDGQHVYWTSVLAGTIGRANLDGTGVDRFFIGGANTPLGVAVDAHHIYWTNGTTIGRANLDGTGVEQNFITGAHGPEAVAVDTQHVYWSNASSNSIGRANLDGSSPDQSFISLLGVSGPAGVAVDGQHIYWTSDLPGMIGRANLDGTAANLTFLSAGDSHPRGVAVDSGHIYWANLTASTIGRANLDGSSPDPNFIAGPSPWGLAVDPLPYATAARIACVPVAVTQPASTNCTATITDIAGAAAPTGTVAFTSAAGSFRPSASCALVSTGSAQSTCQVSFIPRDIGTVAVSATYPGDNTYAASTTTASVTIHGRPSTRPAKPSNAFALSRPKLDTRNGNASVIVTVPGPGKLLLRGTGIRKLAESVPHRGKVTLMVNATGKARQRLSRAGKATVTARITYTPTGGAPNTKSKTLTLKRRRR